MQLWRGTDGKRKRQLNAGSAPVSSFDPAFAAETAHPLANVLQSFTMAIGSRSDAAAVVTDRDLEGTRHARLKKDFGRAGMFHDIVQRLAHREEEPVAAL